MPLNTLAEELVDPNLLPSLPVGVHDNPGTSGGLAGLSQRDDRKRAEPDADGLAIDARPLAPGPRMPSELHRLDQQREPVAAASVAVPPGSRHGLDECGGRLFRSSFSLWGYALSYALHGENAGNLSLRQDHITILISVS